jgi:phospholipase/carboxylesterase
LKQSADAGDARLRARPQRRALDGPPGLAILPVDGERDSFLYVPHTLDRAAPAPLLVLLHGAGGHAHQALNLLRGVPEARRTMLLAPASSAFTWDVVVDDYGSDVTRIDRALRAVFERYVVDSERVGIAGFSDGASYALSLGLTNGDLFTHIIAFSPGFAAPPSSTGRPRVFVSHGIGDPVLPVDACSRTIVPRLRRSGLEVEYLEFDGGHTVPSELAAAALRWFLPGDRPG